VVGNFRPGLEFQPQNPPSGENGHSFSSVVSRNFADLQATAPAFLSPRLRRIKAARTDAGCVQVLEGIINCMLARGQTLSFLLL